MSGDRKDGQKGQPDDVRDMLRQLASQIKDQIADVDRRHNAALKTMEHRLASHTQPASEVDAWDMDAAEALTCLYEADGQAAPGASTKPAIAAPAQPAAPQRPRGGAAPTVAARPAAPAKPVLAAPATAASTTAAPAPTPPVREPQAKAMSVAATRPASPSKPLGERTPAAQVDTPALYFSDPPLPSGAGSQASMLAAAAVAAPSAAAWLASDRSWLDDRLADLHAKVDATLASFDPTPIIAPVTERIDRLENQIHDSLAGLARTADLDRLGGIETDVAALKDHVASARDQLKRLDGIEHNLASLSRLAEEAQTATMALSPPEHGRPAADADRIAEIEAMLRDLHTYAADQQANPAPALDMPDFHALAEKAAERAAQHIVEQHKDLFSPAKRAEMHAQALAQAQGAAGPSLDDMQALLDRYQEEHRREQEQVASTLTTMQEALIRLIDRIEELAGEGGEQVETTHEAPERFVEVADERGQRPGRRASDHEQVTEQTAAAPRHAAAAVSAEAMHQSRPAAPQVQPRATPRMQPAPAPQPAPPVAEMSVEDAAAALAAERARVQAERAQSRRSAMPRPQMTVASDPEDAAAEADSGSSTGRPAPKSKPRMSAAKTGLIAATTGGLLFLAGWLAMPLFGKRVAETKLGDRVPRAVAVTAPAPAPVQRPSSIPTETFEPAGQRATPTPSILEAQPSTAPPRPQPAASAPLTSQPAPREAPLPQVSPQGRAVDTPAAPSSRRPLPETVTDDLSSNSQEPTDGQAVAHAGAAVVTASAQGIALEQPGLMSPHELARRQARLAPAEAQPPVTTRLASEPVDNTPEALARGRIEMPPAQIGPMSLRVAAQQGDPGAAFEVATRFAEAKGVKQDYQQAIAWYSRAAQQGFGPAQYRLATIYEGGLHGTQDLPRARIWYRRAADQGNVKAMHNLAVLATGTGQSQPDYATAARWFSEAADRGLADSQFNLGVLHESGLGVGKDQLQAYKWFTLAARSGDKEALKRRDQLMATFTPQVAQQAERLVNLWRAKPTDLKANDPRLAATAWREQQERAMLEMQARIQAQQQPAAQQQQPAQQAQPTQPAQPQAAQPLVDRLLGAPTPAPTAGAATAPKAPVPRSTASIPRQ